MKTTLLALSLCLALYSGASGATELPVLAGSAPTGVRISSDGSQMLVSSSQKNNVITWKSFSISEDALATFDNRNYLNLVTGGAPSRLDGRLIGFGNVYIVNPAGITQGINSSLQALKLGLSTARLSDAQVKAFESTGLLEPSGLGIGRINLLGEICTDNLVIDGGQVVIRDVANLMDHSGDPLNNRSYEKITVKSSQGRIDVGGDADTALADYGFTGGEYVSHLGQTPISTKDEFLKIGATGEYFITNDLDLGELASPLLADSDAGFSGTLEGCMSRVSFSLNDTREGSGLYAGLFSKLTDAEVADLFLKAQLCLPNATGAALGALAGTVSGSTLKNVTAVTQATLASKNLSLTAGGLSGELTGINRLQNVTACLSAPSLEEDGSHSLGSLVGKLYGTVKTTGLVGGTGTAYVTGNGYGDLETSLADKYAVLTDEERAQFVTIGDDAFYAHKGFYDAFGVENFTLEKDEGKPDYDALASSGTPFTLSKLMDVSFDAAQSGNGKYVFALTADDSLSAAVGGDFSSGAAARSYYFVNTLEDGSTTQSAQGRALVTVTSASPDPVTPDPENPDPVTPEPVTPDPATPTDPQSPGSDEDYAWYDGYPSFTAYGGFLDDDGDDLESEKSRILKKDQPLRASLALKAPALEDALIASLHEQNCEILAAVALRSKSAIAANSNNADEDPESKA